MNLKHNILKFAICSLLPALTACSDEIFSPLLQNDGEYFELNFSLNLDEAMGGSAKSRTTFSDEVDEDKETEIVLNNDDEENQIDPKTASIVLLCFDENNLLDGAYKGTYVGHDESTHLVNYTVKLPSSSSKHYVHVIVNHNTLAADLSAVPFATESAVFNDEIMTTTQNVYWRRVELEKVTKDIAETKLSGLKLIRNYSKLRLRFKLAETTKYTAEDFTKVEWGLMCYPTLSFVAPYLNDQNFATYVHSETNSTAAYTYDELYNEGYRCHVPRTSANADSFYSLSTSADANNITWKNWNDPLYVYENEGYSDVSSWKKIAIMLKCTTTDGNVWYYRISLSDPDRNNETLYIMRNIKYVIDVTSINDTGFTTPAEAYIKAAANNVSGSTSTSTFTNVSANGSALRVEYVKKYILKPTEFTMLARYIPDIEDVDKYGVYASKNECIKLHSAEGYKTTTNADGTVTTTEPEFMGPDNTQFAIKGKDYDSVNSYDDNYAQFTFYPNTPQGNDISTVTRVKVAVEDSDNQYSSALYRNVEFILRNRYLMRNMRIVHDYDSDDDGVTKEYDSTTDTNGGDDRRSFILTVEVPANTPEQLFPLEFSFETDPDDVYPNAIKSVMKVTDSDGSLFDDVTDSFHYHRAVTWAHFNDKDKFEEVDGYKRITFFFKINDSTIKEGDTIRFAVWSDTFSTSPNDELSADRPAPLIGTYTFGIDEDDDNVMTLTPVGAETDESTDQTE